MEAAGVQPDHSFLLAQTSFLSGIIPVGAYMADHIWENSYSLVRQQQLQRSFARSCKRSRGAFLLEIGIIWLPILVSLVLRLLRLVSRQDNASQYPWVGNWMFTTQRWTGLIAFRISRVAWIHRALLAPADFPLTPAFRPPCRMFGSSRSFCSASPPARSI